MPGGDGRGPSNGGNSRRGNQMRNAGRGGRGNGMCAGNNRDNLTFSESENIQSRGFGRSGGRSRGFGRGICRNGFGANLQDGENAGQGIMQRKRLRDQSCTTNK